MSGRSYPRLSIAELGEQLVTSGDLDPVYVALNNSGLPERQRLRWLVAYCAFYSCGAACFLSEFEGAAFWHWMGAAARNDEPTPVGGRWPRGHERRHFRGGAAQRGIADWAGHHPWPESMFRFIAGQGGTVNSVISRARSHYSVGQWLGFKMADLVDACLGVALDQTDLDPFLYDTPRRSLLRVWTEDLHPGAAPPEPERPAVVEALGWLAAQLRHLTSPHKAGQPLDAFCLETVACKHLSHLHGHYPLFNDLDDIRHGLEPWLPASDAARAFRAALPPSPEKERT